MLDHAAVFCVALFKNRSTPESEMRDALPVLALSEDLAQQILNVRVR
jgi:hypothetical protein